MLGDPVVVSRGGKPDLDKAGDGGGEEVLAYGPAVEENEAGTSSAQATTEARSDMAKYAAQNALGGIKHLLPADRQSEAHWEMPAEYL